MEGPSQTQLRTPAPDFDLLGVDGARWSLESFAADRPLVVMFLCNHCPYVVATRERLVELANEYAGRVEFAAICSNDAERYPDDGFEPMKRVAADLHFPFPYLHDESQEVAEAYGAVCTPDIFVYDSERLLAYRGRIDDNWRDAAGVTRQDLKMALDALLAGALPDPSQPPAMGCSIKWKY